MRQALVDSNTLAGVLICLMRPSWRPVSLAGHLLRIDQFSKEMGIAQSVQAIPRAATAAR